MNTNLATGSDLSRVLFVDDDRRVLAAYRRTLRGRFHLDTACSATEAMQMIDPNDPYAVVVSDFHMPEVDGIELLNSVKKVAPSTVRIMLTGDVDQRVVDEAANKGEVFNLLHKPCSPEVLTRSLAAAVAQFRSLDAGNRTMSAA